MSNRPYNFGAGPAVLPESVLEKAQKELLSYDGSGVSVMEMSHRSPAFLAIIQRVETSLRQLMGIPEGYHVLFLQGGASTQFAMVPLNLLRTSRSADFVNTGSWATMAIQETERFGTARVVASSKERGFAEIPILYPAVFDDSADFFHVTSNNTIHGTRYDSYPETGTVPLVADMSSCILSEPVDVARFGLIYAGAQKNIGPAGLTIVVIRDELVGHASSETPTMLNYQTHTEKKSLFNTPPCYAIYVAGLVFEWIAENGGVAGMAARNKEKAKALYEYLDNSRFFSAKIAPPHRSLMNITIGTPSPNHDKAFVEQAARAGLLSLAGHRSVGGIRASLYNAMTLEGTQALINFMSQYERENI